MAESWPKLKLMYRLNNKEQLGMKRNRQRADLKEHLEELRSDVVCLCYEGVSLWTPFSIVFV